jgi:aminotransferase
MIYSEAELKALSKVITDAGIYCISDEIYEKLVYDGQKHASIASFGDEIKNLTITVNGVSKVYAMTGWRIGYAAGPADIIKGMIRIHQYTIMSAPTTAQDAAITALADGEIYVQEMQSEYNRRRRLLVDGLNKLGLKTFEPLGAFYAFPNISASGMNDETFCQRLLEEEHVAVVPGNSFGPGGEGFVRACYATAYEKIEEALRRMEKFMNRYG